MQSVIVWKCFYFAESSIVEENISFQEKSPLEPTATKSQSREQATEFYTSSRAKDYSSKSQSMETEMSYTYVEDPAETSNTNQVPPPTDPKPQTSSERHDDSMPLLNTQCIAHTEGKVQQASITVESGSVKVRQSTEIGKKTKMLQRNVAGKSLSGPKHTERLESGGGKKRKAERETKAGKEHKSADRDMRRVTQSKETTVEFKSEEQFVWKSVNPVYILPSSIRHM